MNYLRSRGFTLVELLIVMTMIGLMVVISYVVMMQYADRAKDTAIQMNISNLRNTAVMIYTEKNSYASLCNPDGTLNDSNPVLKEVEDSVANITGAAPVCHAQGKVYCIRTSLFTADYFCIDSTGLAVKQTSQECAANKIRCSP